jgi:hypothetical protein
MRNYSNLLAFDLLTRRTGHSAICNANGRLTAMLAHRAEMEALTVTGKAESARHQRYLETVVMLLERRALSRNMYFAKLATE